MKRTQKSRPKFLLWLSAICIVTVLILLGITRSSGSPESSLNRKQTFSANMDEELQRLFIEHPMEEVSKKLWREIMSGKVKLGWNEEIKGYGFFATDPFEMMGFNQRYLRNALRTEIGIKTLSTIIYHEAIHHRQYHDRGEKKLEGNCETLWLVEQEASIGQCLLAKQLGIHKELQLCNLIDDERFDQELLTRLIEDDPNFSKCQQFLGRVAIIDIQ